MRTTSRAALAAATALTLALSSAACAADETTPTTGASRSAETSATTGSADATAIVTMDDGWVRATDTEMSGVFGAIRNPGGTDVLLTGVTGSLGGHAELHETVPGGGGMSMREKEGGFLIPAGGELLLQPGGDHIMLMDLDRPITAGQEITLTLVFDGGAEQDVTVSARDFRGGHEEYVGDGHEGAGPASGHADSGDAAGSHDG